MNRRSVPARTRRSGQRGSTTAQRGQTFCTCATQPDRSVAARRRHAGEIDRIFNNENRRSGGQKKKIRPPDLLFSLLIQILEFTANSEGGNDGEAGERRVAREIVARLIQLGILMV